MIDIIKAEEHWDIYSVYSTVSVNWAGLLRDLSIKKFCSCRVFFMSIKT